MSPTQAALGHRQGHDSLGDCSSAHPTPHRRPGGGVSHGLCASQARDALGREGGRETLPAGKALEVLPAVTTSEPPPTRAQLPAGLWALPACRSHSACPLPSAPLDCYDSGLVLVPREAGPMVPRDHENGRAARLPHCDHVGRAGGSAGTSSPCPPPPRLSPAGPALALAGTGSVSPHVPSSLVGQSVSCAPVLRDPVPLRGRSVPGPPGAWAGLPGPPAISRPLQDFGPGRHSAGTSAEAAAAHPYSRLILVLSAGSAKCFSTLLKESNK